MAEKYQRQEAPGYPLAPPTMPRSDAESATINYQSQPHMKKRKRMKCLACTAIFALILAVVIVAVALIFFRVRTPRMRLGDINITNNGNSTNSFSARVFIRNRNFGRYKINDNTLGTIRTTEDNVVGRFVIPDARIRARSTRRIFVVSQLSSINANSGSLDLRVEARVRGEVEFLRVFDRKKTAHLRCTVTISLPNNVVQGVRCDN